MTNELSKRVRLIPSAPAGRMVRSRKSTSTVNVNSQRQQSTSTVNVNSQRQQSTSTVNVNSQRQQSASEYTYQLILTSRS